MSVYLIDLDGVLATKGHGGDYARAQPIPEAIAQVNALHEEGHIIIIWTARLAASGWADSVIPLTVKQLKEWGVKYDEVDFSKRECDAIVDDKNATLDELLTGG